MSEEDKKHFKYHTQKKTRVKNAPTTNLLNS